ncbi:MAG TPA: CcmD family protein [Polyangiales bacterium]|jgi:CcmD family protein|nr:CcmD family protein [Polyangiales bacterium]
MYSQLRRGFWLAALLCTFAGVALAQDPQGADAAGDRATSFQTVEGAVKEDVPGGPLLVAAYGFVWIAVLGYVLRLGRMQARVEANIATLERALSSGPNAPKSGAGTEPG